MYARIEPDVKEQTDTDLWGIYEHIASGVAATFDNDTPRKDPMIIGARMA